METPRGLLTSSSSEQSPSLPQELDLPQIMKCPMLSRAEEDTITLKSCKSPGPARNSLMPEMASSSRRH